MCDKCGMTFYHNSNLKKHLETAHTGSRLMVVQPSVYPILGHPADMVGAFSWQENMFHCHLPRASASTTSTRRTATLNSSITTITSTATITSTTTLPTIQDNGGSSTRITVSTIKIILSWKRITAGKRIEQKIQNLGILNGNDRCKRSLAEKRH